MWPTHRPTKQIKGDDTFQGRFVIIALLDYGLLLACHIYKYIYLDRQPNYALWIRQLAESKYEYKYRIMLRNGGGSWSVKANMQSPKTIWLTRGVMSYWWCFVCGQYVNTTKSTIQRVGRFFSGWPRAKIVRGLRISHDTGILWSSARTLDLSAFYGRWRYRPHSSGRGLGGRPVHAHNQRVSILVIIHQTHSFIASTNTQINVLLGAQLDVRFVRTTPLIFRQILIHQGNTFFTGRKHLDHDGVLCVLWCLNRSTTPWNVYIEIQWIPPV